MNPQITDIVNKWINATVPFSFEKRLCFRCNQIRHDSDEPFTQVVMIIDVDGFFEDEKHTCPIKLHYERVFTIDNKNHTQQYVENFNRDLDLFTDTAHEAFMTILSSFPSPTYTSDPLYMKV